MEVVVSSTSGLPKSGLLAITAGCHKYARPVDGVEGGRWMFPSNTGGTPSEEIDIELYMPVSARRASLGESLRGSHTKLELQAMPGQGDIAAGINGSPMHVDFTFRQLGSSAGAGAALTPRKAGAGGARRHEQDIAAEKYLDLHGIPDLIQTLLQGLVREQPDDPYSFAATHFRRGASALAVGRAAGNVAGTSVAAQPAPEQQQQRQEEQQQQQDQQQQQQRVRATLPIDALSGEMTPAARAEEKLRKLLEENPHLNPKYQIAHGLQKEVVAVQEALALEHIAEAEAALGRITSSLHEEPLSPSSGLLCRSPSRSIRAAKKASAREVSERLEALIAEHSFLDPANGSRPHPLHYWVVHCRTDLKSGDEKHLRRAMADLGRIEGGLEADLRHIAAGFNRFDVDNNGSLDESEVRHCCAFLGWTQEETSQFLATKDSQISLDEFVDFVGRMGGVQHFWEQRRQRICLNRSDICGTSGVAIGSRVRAHFYVDGKKSNAWEEAQVLAVNVPGFPDAPHGGVRLQFGFTLNESGHHWKATQVVPPRWILSTLGEAAVAAALREVGILDEDQSFWSSVLPMSEMLEIHRLAGCQREALSLVRRQAILNHDGSMPELRQKFADLGLGSQELIQVLDWIQEKAIVVIHVNIDKVGRYLETDEFYRNQFETGSSGGTIDDGNETRKGWERELFGQAYDSAKPFERCKYGALAVMNDYRGVMSALQYGDSYLVLKDVRLRCTFASEDSGGIDGSRLAVLDKYAHVLNEFNENELEALIEVVCTDSHSEPPQVLRGVSEDSLFEWLTFGFPELAQKTGRFFFEVEMLKGAESPQVGVLSSDFVLCVGQRSSGGVGDDEHGWAVDGAQSARWHAGRMHPWRQTWCSDHLGQLAASHVVGVAVDLDARQLWFATDGRWFEDPAFGPDDIPAGAALYPALSVQGKAAFIFGPDFRHGLPKWGEFQRWPGTPVKQVRVDCPRVGDSDVLREYKEAQIHGEVNLKRNVQRLVAHPKYRDTPKPKRRFDLVLSGAGSCSGSYVRDGAHNEAPLYTKYDDDSEGVIYWDLATEMWHVHSKPDFTKWTFRAPPKAPWDLLEPPRSGWRATPEQTGTIPLDVVRSVLRDESGFDAQAMEDWFSSNSVKDCKGQEVVYKATFGIAWEASRGDRGSSTLEDVWGHAISEVKRRVIEEAGFPGAVVVESPHPYPAKPHSWQRNVHVVGATQLGVVFSTRCRTADACSELTVKPTSPSRSAHCAGRRVEVALPFGGGCQGSVVGSHGRGDNTITAVQLDIDEDHPLLRSTSERLMCWPESLRSASVKYSSGGGAAGNDILGLELDLSFPLTPIRVLDVAPTGQAAAVGVQSGWFVDLEATLLGPSHNVFETLAEGPLPQDVEGLYESIHAVHRWLEAALSLDNVDIVFTNGSQGRQLPAVHVLYPSEQSIGSEVILEADPSAAGSATVAAFKRDGGPAQRACVKVGWRFNPDETFGWLNPGPLPNFTYAELVSAAPDFSMLLEASDVRVVFSPLAKDEEGGEDEDAHYASGDSWESMTIPGDTALFSFSSDGAGSPARRWGVFALVFSAMEGVIPRSREDVDALMEGWTEASARAQGLSETPVLDCENWDEARLRALCAHHGWEFEWVSEDGERRRRVREDQQDRARAPSHGGLETGEPKRKPAVPDGCVNLERDK